MLTNNIFLKNKFDIIEVVCFCPSSKQESDDIVKWCKVQYGKSHGAFYSSWWTSRRIVPYSLRTANQDDRNMIRSQYNCVIVKKTALTSLMQLVWG